MAGITHVLKTVDDLEAILGDLIKVSSGGVLSRARGVLDLCRDLDAVVSVLGEDLVEIKDLDAKEAGAVMVRAYDLLYNLVKMKVKI